jgi:hypothetical protein
VWHNSDIHALLNPGSYLIAKLKKYELAHLLSRLLQRTCNPFVYRIAKINGFKVNSTALVLCDCQQIEQTTPQFKQIKATT